MKLVKCLRVGVTILQLKNEENNDTETVSHKKFLTASRLTAKCMHGEKSVQQKVPQRKVLTAKCPFDEMSGHVKKSVTNNLIITESVAKLTTTIPTLQELILLQSGRQVSN